MVLLDSNIIIYGSQHVQDYLEKEQLGVAANVKDYSWISDLKIHNPVN